MTDEHTATHTPGPYAYTRGGSYFIITDSKHRVVAMLSAGGADLSAEEAEANAALFAGSPDLFAIAAVATDTMKALLLDDSPENERIKGAALMRWTELEPSKVIAKTKGTT